MLTCFLLGHQVVYKGKDPILLAHVRPHPITPRPVELELTLPLIFALVRPALGTALDKAVSPIMFIFRLLVRIDRG